MSKRHSDNITCPKCKHDNEFEVWESVNVQLDPEMKDKILNSEAFHFVCEECGYSATVNYTLLYHDMEKKMMIYLLPDDENEIKSAAEFMNTSLDCSHKDLMDGYSNRIVTSIHELQEKIYIADDGYDDRIIEIMKVLFMGMMAEQTPDQKVDEILYDKGTNGQHLMLFWCDNKCFANVPFDDKFYNDVADNYREKIEAFPSEYFIYDFLWARDLIFNNK